jgi:hypothetical protein
MGLQFTWSAVTGAKTYSLYVDDEEQTIGIMPTASAPGWAYRMVPGLTYNVQVRAFDAAGQGGEFSLPLILTPTVTPITGTKHIHLQQLTFPDVEPIQKSDIELAAIMNTMSTWFLKVSGKRFTYTYSLSGWRTAPMAITEYCKRIPPKPDGSSGTWQANGGLWYGLLSSLTQMPDVNTIFSDHPPADSYVWIVNGTGETGFSNAFSARWVDVFGFLHECGHQLGLLHAGDIAPQYPETRRAPEDLFDDSDPRWFWGRYTDPYDPMGGNAGIATFNYSAHNLDVLGWLPPNATREVTTGVYQIAPIDGPNWRWGPRELRVPLGEKGLYYSIDYRQDIDAIMVRLKHPLGGNPDTTTNLVYPSTGKAIKYGQSVTDDFRDLRIHYWSKILGWAKVKVERIT